MLKTKIGGWLIEAGLTLFPEEFRNGTTIDNCIKTKMLKVDKAKHINKIKDKSIEYRVINKLQTLLNDTVTIHDTKETLELDSLDEIECIMALEDEFDICIEDNVTKSLNSVEDVIVHIESKLNK